MIERRLRNRIQEGYRQLFKDYPHEVMITVHFGNRAIQNQTPYEQMRRLVTHIAKYKRTQVAGFGVYNRLKTSHAHLLLFGKTQPLNDIATCELERMWKHGSIDVQTNVDHGASFYLALNTTPHCQDKFELCFFNLRILKKYREQCSLPCTTSPSQLTG